MGDRTAFLSAAIIGGTAAMLFLLFLAAGIYGGDSGDLVTAAVVRGVPHPPGYPLYTLLGHILTHVPFGTPAWQVGLLSLMPHAIVVSLVFAIVRRETGKLYPAIICFFFTARLRKYLGCFLFFFMVSAFCQYESAAQRKKETLCCFSSAWGYPSPTITSLCLSFPQCLYFSVRHVSHA